MVGKIRASFSFLNLWEQGKIDDALRAYFHIEQATPNRYQEGKKLDEYAQEYMKNHAKLPPEWGGDSLDDYHVQYRVKVEFSPICDVVGVFDVLEPKVITELKSGISSSGDYARSYQVPIYLFLASKINLPIDYARIIRYNQHTNETDRAIIYTSPRIIERATNYIESIVPEIHEYFEKHDLFKDEETIKLRLTNAK